MAATSVVAMPVVTVSGDITGNTFWTNNNIYLLTGNVYVKNNSTLIIQGGTLVKGDKTTKGTLIITKGSKLISNGTQLQPIVFTSSQNAGARAAGDWGGIVVLGNAAVNNAGGVGTIGGTINNGNNDGQYGGSTAADNNGVFRYTRVEYAGADLGSGFRLAGITFGGCGSASIVEHVMVSYSAGNGFDFYGGTINARWLVSNKCNATDYFTTNGYIGMMQFIVAQRDPAVASVANCSNFESDNNATGTNAAPVTKAIISNATLIGSEPDTSVVGAANFKYNVNFTNATKSCIYNSVIMGSPKGFHIGGNAAEANATANNIQARNCVSAGSNSNLSVNNGSSFNINSWWNNGAYNNVLKAFADSVHLKNPFSQTAPNFLPDTSSILDTNASFTNANLANAFFTTVRYEGAFSDSSDWTSCWTHWNPQQEVYDTTLAFVTPTASFYISANDTLISFTNTSVNATAYFWDFGDGTVLSDTSSAINPTYIYPGVGIYTVTLIAITPCGNDTLLQNINISGINEPDLIGELKLFPNPASKSAKLNITMNQTADATIELYDIAGKKLDTVYSGVLEEGKQQVKINVANLDAGIYLVKISVKGKMTMLKLVKE